MNRWRVTVELNLNKDDFKTCIIEAENETKVKSMAEKYFIKKFKATHVSIIGIDLIESNVED